MAIILAIIVLPILFIEFIYTLVSIHNAGKKEPVFVYCEAEKKEKEDALSKQIDEAFPQFSEESKAELLEHAEELDKQERVERARRQEEQALEYEQAMEEERRRKAEYEEEREREERERQEQQMRDLMESHWQMCVEPRYHS